MEILSETLNGLGYVFRSGITEKRRSLLKPKLPDDFKVLVTDKCSPSPTNLLGDLSENTKKCSETDKITSQMDKASTSKGKGKKSGGQHYRGKPYDKPSSSSYNSNKRGGFFNRRYDRRSSYDRSDNRSNNNSNSSFRRGGQSRK